MNVTINFILYYAHISDVTQHVSKHYSDLQPGHVMSNQLKLRFIGNCRTKKCVVSVLVKFKSIYQSIAEQKEHCKIHGFKSFLLLFYLTKRLLQVSRTKLQGGVINHSILCFTTSCPDQFLPASKVID